MTNNRLNLTLDIITIGRKDVNVRASLAVASLIENIRDKCNLDGGCELRAANGKRGPLPADMPLDQLAAYGVVDGATLVCQPLARSTGTAELIRAGNKLKLSRSFKRVFLFEPNTLREFQIQWQPAIIGRRNVGDPKQNRLVAADLSDLDTMSAVSRHHACILEQNGKFSIEALQGRNPIYLGERRIMPGESAPLATGAALRMGSISLLFRIID